MKETPLLFTPENVRKVLAGTKTQTRRIVNPQPRLQMTLLPTGLWATVCNGDGLVERSMRCPYGQPGDRLWVREAWRRVRTDDDCVLSDWAIEYRADGHKNNWRDNEGWFDNEPILNPPWKPSIHMPKKFCRLWLKLTDVRVERLQEISLLDVGEEGYAVRVDGGSPSDFSVPWNKINGPANEPGSWEQNPFVWVLTFKVVMP